MDLLSSPSPSRFGPGFGKKSQKLRFFSGREDVRYQWGSNDHLKGRFGADLSTHMPDTFGPESDPLCSAQRNRAAVAAWLVSPDRPSHPGNAFSAPDYRRPEESRLTLPEVQPRWAKKLHLSTSERGMLRWEIELRRVAAWRPGESTLGPPLCLLCCCRSSAANVPTSIPTRSLSRAGLAPLMEQRKYEDLKKGPDWGITRESLDPQSSSRVPRAPRGVKLGPGFGVGATPSRFPVRTPPTDLGTSEPLLLLSCCCLAAA